MKPPKKLIVCALILFLVIFYFHKKNKYTDNETGNMPNAISVSANEGRKLPTAAERKEEIAPTADELRKMVETPVEFYGQILDQHNNPVEGAKIRCSWVYISPTQSPIEVSTESGGRFEIKGLKAISISILVYPPAGYRVPQVDPEKLNDYIQIADPPERIQKHQRYGALPPTVKSMLFIAEAYKPDKNTPKIFRVEKIGLSDALYERKLVNYNKNNNGSALWFSLKKGSEGKSDRPVDEYSFEYSFYLNESEREANKKDWKSNKQWSWGLKIKVPGGGIQVVPGDHSLSRPEEVFKGNEIAPEIGYQEEIIFDFPKDIDASRWKDRMQTGCFIRFKDGTYARIVINAHEDLVSVQSYFNPTGSNNLKFDYSKRIKE